MAGGPGEDETIAGAQTAEPAEGHPAAHAVSSDQPRPAASAPSAAGSPASEWTVSDRRGPLNAAAAPDDDVERFVPGSETDAEGAHDTITPSHVSAPVGSSASEPASTVADGGTPETAIPPAARTIDPGQATENGDHPHVEDAAPQAHGTAPTAAVTSPSEPRRLFLPLVAAAVLGALIGAGSAALVYSELSGSSGIAKRDADGGRLASLSTRVDALEKRPDPVAPLATIKGQVDDLATKVAALGSRSSAAAPSSASVAPTSKAPESKPPVSGTSVSAPPPPSATPSAPAQAQPSADGPAALNAKVAALQASVDVLQKQNGSRDLAGKLEALQASMTGVQTLASNARTNVDTLKSQQQAFDGKLGDLQNAVGTAQKQASAAKSGVDVLQGEQKTLAGKLGAPAIAVVADSLVAQIAAGKPYPTQVDALASLGADPVQVALLRQNASSGVSSSQALLAKFAQLVDPIIATGSKAPANANFGERLKHGLFGLVNVRRTDGTTGNDLPSRVALIQSDLANNDVVGAFAAWNALPAEAKQASVAWGTSAKASVEAIAAGRSLQTQSIGALAAKKS